jgi:hypothetical protein
MINKGKETKVILVMINHLNKEVIILIEKGTGIIWMLVRLVIIVKTKWRMKV